MGKIEKLATWLDHGKTVFDILVALGGGRLFGALLTTYTKIPARWITPIWLLASAGLLWILLKTVRSKQQWRQEQGSQSIMNAPVGQPLAAVNQYYHRIDPRYTGEIEAAIRQTAGQVPVPDRDTYLFRSLTVALIYVQFETLWWNIFASQIKALQHLNNGQLKRETIFPYYAEAAAANPSFYAEYSFDKWLGFMRSHVVIREDGDLIGITVKGKDFLKFLIDDCKPVAAKSL